LITCGAFSGAGIRLEESGDFELERRLPAVQAPVARGVAASATDAGLPIINNDREFLDKGALATVGIGFHESGVAAASSPLGCCAARFYVRPPAVLERDSRA
jgi:hypothetical protein